MAYRLIAIDLDDTLLDDKISIPPRVAKAIGQATEQGVRVVLCTGRTKKGVQRFYDELHLDTLLISSGGAEIHDAGGRVVFERAMDPKLVRELLDFCYAEGLHAQVYIDGELAFRDRNPYAEIYEKPYGFRGVEMPELASMERVITPKVLLVVDEDKIEDVQRRTVEMFPNLTIMRSRPMFLEYADPGVSKGEALAFVANHYAVSREEIIAIGDSEIDIPMLEYAGLGVAVANAHPAVQRAADIICPSHLEFGVADVIEKYLLEEKHENHA